MRARNSKLIDVNMAHGCYALEVSTQSFENMCTKRMLLFSLVVVASVGANNITEPSISTNCRQRPRKLIKTAKVCCEVPTPHFEDYIGECSNFGDTNATLYCQLECLFNASSALTDQNLNLARLHKLLDQVFPGAVNFVAAYYISFEECIPLVRKALKYRQGIKHKCSPTALLYAACAQMKLIKHCPPEAWNDTLTCEEARNYVNNCSNQLLPFKRRNANLKIVEFKQLKSEETNSDNDTDTKNTNDATETSRLVYNTETTMKTDINS